MKEVVEGLFVGDANDFYSSLLCTYEPVKSEMEILMNMPEGWAVCHACKEPFHRMALQYTGRGAPKDHPEYLWSERMGNRLAMNIVDAPKSFFFDKGMIDKALNFIRVKLKEGLKVLVHCNEGMSRSPSIALLYLVRTKKIDVDTLEEAEAEFLKIYPSYNPGTGIRDFVKENWDYYNTPF